MGQDEWPVEQNQVEITLPSKPMLLGACSHKSLEDLISRRYKNRETLAARVSVHSINQWGFGTVASSAVR